MHGVKAEGPDRRIVRVRVRRLVCPTHGCLHTFREQVPGVLEHYRVFELDGGAAVASELADHAV